MVIVVVCPQPDLSAVLKVDQAPVPGQMLSLQQAVLMHGSRDLKVAQVVGPVYARTVTKAIFRNGDKEEIGLPPEWEEGSLPTFHVAPTQEYLYAPLRGHD